MAVRDEPFVWRLLRPLGSARLGGRGNRTSRMPAFQFGLERVDGATLCMFVAVNWKRLNLLPALDRRDTAPEERRDLLPGIKPVVGRIHAGRLLVVQLSHVRGNYRRSSLQWIAQLVLIWFNRARGRRVDR